MNEEQRELLAYLIYRQSFEKLTQEQQRKIDDVIRIKGGSATFHIDKDGNIQEVVIDTRFKV